MPETIDFNLYSNPVTVKFIFKNLTLHVRKDGRERVQKPLLALLISLFLHYERSKMFTAFLSFQQQICEHSSGKLRWLSITRALGRHVFIFENKI